MKYTESSPLNRIIGEYGPGENWYANNKKISTAYLTNISGNTSLNSLLYTVGGTPQSPTLIKKGNYSTGQLDVTEAKDEDGNIFYEFKDKLERIILTRQMNGNIYFDTYYVYNEFGNLCFVLPPRIDNEGISLEKLNELAYLYKYDSRNRCIAKKLPGVDWIYYIYDLEDRLIFSQTGEQRNRNEWMFSIPDEFGRVVLTGYYIDPLMKYESGLHTVVKAIYGESRDVYFNREPLVMLLNGYRISGVFLSDPVLLSVHYYDNYDFIDSTDVPNDVNFRYNSESDYAAKRVTHPKTLLTGTLTAQMNPDGTISPTYLYAVMYYDDRGRLIQTKSNNHLSGGIEKEYITYNFVGQPVRRKLVHSVPGKNTQTEEYAYIYDHAGRLLKTTHQLTDGTIVKPLTILAENTYDELGRLQATTANEQTSLKSTYTYDVRSQTDSITNTHLSQKLAYTFGGNIKEQQWTQANKTRKYTFEYDSLSRLTSAVYTGDGSYGTAYKYDKHGNITNLIRNGSTGTTTYGVIDNLTFTYNGNQLKNISESAANPTISTSADFRKNTSLLDMEYFFDKNGNMIKDLNKGISNISYNYLNLPSSLTISNSFGSATNTYVYAADGRKLSVSKGSNKTDYVGNKIYENGVLKRILTENGYIENGIYYFYIKDHLGNNRIVANQSGTIVQSTQYYPFGMAFADGTNPSTQPYKYNGKELDGERGLNLYDYSARYMDGVFGRFTTPDPMAEKYYSISPYVYCGNNPINAVDFNGDSITIVHRSGFLGLGGKGTLTYENGNLFNADGSAYAGKVKGYLKSAVGALGSLNATTEGAALVSELQNSTNMFTIKSGDNAFVPNSPVRAGANLVEVQAATGNMAGSSGSGGTIYWNANSTSGGLELTGSTSRPAYIGLGHEMGHASDSNQGLLHYRNDYTNAATGVTYFSSYNGLLKSEWRAVYRENIIRGQSGIPLRTHYGINMSTGVPVGIGPILLSPLNRPLNYP